MRKRLALLALMVALYAIGAFRNPSGGWDYRAIWGLRASMLNGHGFVVAYTAENDHPHRDYPPLLPLVIAAGWRVGISAHVVHGLLFAALVWLASERLWAGALVGAAVLTYAPTQLADVPLALCLLVAVVCYQRGRHELCGLALGLGALTKNEGALIALVFVATWAIMERRIPLTALRGASVPITLLIAFKLAFPNASDIVGVEGTITRLLEPTRYLVIALYVIPATAQWAMGAFGVLATGLLLTRTRARLNVPLVAVALVWCGYCFIYVVTPHPLDWHLQSSYDRLLVHLFPSFVVALIPQTTTTR